MYKLLLVDASIIVIEEYRQQEATLNFVKHFCLSSRILVPYYISN